MLETLRTIASFGGLSAIAIVTAGLMALPYQAMAAAGEQGELSLIMGAGALPCAEFGQRLRNSVDIEQTFFAWGQGYMSGMNTMFDFAGSDTRDMNAISVSTQEERVRSYCASHPLQSYSDGVRELYLSLPIVPSMEKPTP
jgi:hypothetical protein